MRDFYHVGQAPAAEAETAMLALILVYFCDDKELRAWEAGVLTQEEEHDKKPLEWAPPLGMESTVKGEWARYVMTISRAVANISANLGRPCCIIWLL